MPRHGDGEDCTPVTTSLQLQEGPPIPSLFLKVLLSWERLVKVGMNNTNKIGEGVKFERIRRITGYLVGTLDRFNDAKYAEVKDRVTHEEVKNDVYNKHQERNRTEDSSSINDRCTIQ